MTLSRRSTIKAIGVVGAGSAVSGTALAVSEHEDDERDPEEAPDDEERGAIRVGHFSPDAPNVDVYVDDQQILSDVGYDELSPYLEIEPGTYTLSVTEVDGDEPVYEQTIVVDTEYYTAAAIGELEADEVAENGFADDANGVATDDEAVDANETEADEPETAASVQQDDDGDGVDFGNNDDAANESEAEDGADVDTANESEAEDGVDVDAAEDDVADTGTFEILLLVDDGPEDVEEGTSHLRLVHASPDAPNVDVAEAESGLPIFEDVGFGEPSGYVPVDAGTQALELFEATEGDLAEDADANGADAGNEAGADAGNETDENAADEPETGASIQQDDENATDDETDDDGAELGDDEVIEQDDPVATAEVDLEADMAYTAYAIGYLEEQAAAGDETDLEGEADDADDAGEPETAASIQNDTDDEVDEGEDGTGLEADEGDDAETDDEDDRAFEIRVALDGTEEDEELDEEPDEAEPEEEEIENDDDEGPRHDGNETNADDHGHDGDDDHGYDGDDDDHGHDAEEEPMAADD